jgi:CRISPR-associated protein Cas2
MRFVVAYDISKDRSRKKVADLLCGVLTRVQYSVFEGNVPPEALGPVVRKALRFLDPDTDSLRVYQLCAACAPKVDAYGRKTPVEESPVRIL